MKKRALIIFKITMAIVGLGCFGYMLLKHDGTIDMLIGLAGIVILACLINTIPVSLGGSDQAYIEVFSDQAWPDDSLTDWDVPHGPRPKAGDIKLRHYDDDTWGI